jgi:7-cyano-7-deazaguanosine (preQ0) biosynthesis protein QueE
MTTAAEKATFLVIETFTSIQGEGVRIGNPSTFVRLAHCNLSCAWCDTTYSWKKGEMTEPARMSPKQIFERVGARDVVLTGGEPLLHNLAPLIDELDGHFVTVETNATMFKPDARVGLWSLSPKLGSSGHTPDTGVLGQYLDAYADRMQFKFVVGGREDVEAVKALLNSLPAAVEKRVPIILQPVGHAGEDRDTYCERMRELIEDVLLTDAFWQSYDMRFLPQFHRLVWQDKRGI